MVVTYMIDRTHVPFELVSMMMAESLPYAALRRFHLQCGLVGQCAVSGLHMHVNRPHTHPAYNPKVDQHTSFPMGSMLLVPVRAASNEIVGVIQFAHRQLAAASAPGPRLPLAIISAPGLGSPVPHLQRLSSRPGCICTGTEPHLHPDRAHPVAHLHRD
jgi:hypothetical protein